MVALTLTLSFTWYMSKNLLLLQMLRLSHFSTSNENSSQIFSHMQWVKYLHNQTHESHSFEHLVTYFYLIDNFWTAEISMTCPLKICVLVQCYVSPLSFMRIQTGVFRWQIKKSKERVVCFTMVWHTPGFPHLLQSYFVFKFSDRKGNFVLLSCSSHHDFFYLIPASFWVGQTLSGLLSVTMQSFLHVVPLWMTSSNFWY